MSEIIPLDESSHFYGSHVLGTSVIRIYDAQRVGDELYDKVFSDAPLSNNWTTETIKMNIISLLQSLPRKLDSIVLVNTGFFSYETVQTAASVFPQNTIVKIIPSLMARFLYITNNIQNPIKENEHVLILTKIAGLADFHVLKRKNSIYNFIYEWLGHPVNIPSLFEKYALKYLENGGIAVILYDDANKALTEEIVKQCPHIIFIQTHCSNWNEMLLHGGLNKATTIMSKNAKLIYDVTNFTLGFQLNISEPGSSDGKKIPLIKEGTTIPTKFYDEVMLDKRVKIFSNPTTTMITKAIFKRQRMAQYSQLHNNELHSIKIEIDKNGIESISVNIKKITEIIPQKSGTNGTQEISVVDEQVAGSSNTLSYCRSEALTTTTSNYSSILAKPSSDHHRHNLSTLASHLQQIPPALSPEIIEQQSLILPVPSDFMICLNDRHCCICLPTTEENITKRIPGVNGNVWIPMYVSFLNCPPIFGEAAKRDMNIEPEFVVYDILNLISLPYSEIEIKNEWAFNIAYTGEIEKQTVIEIQTWKGIHTIMPINVLALIFVGLHKEAERVSGKMLKSVFVKTTKTSGRIDKNAIRNAVKIARLECTGVKSMPVLNVT